MLHLCILTETDYQQTLYQHSSSQNGRVVSCLSVTMSYMFFFIVFIVADGKLILPHVRLRKSAPLGILLACYVLGDVVVSHFQKSNMWSGNGLNVFS